MRTFQIPDLDFFLSPDDCQRYPYFETFAEARFKPLVVLHTSGSTGIPKPITMAHGTLATIDAHRLLPSMGEQECIGLSWSGTRLFVAFPVFHAASMCYILGLGIYYGVICVLPPSKTPLNAAIVDAIHTSANVQGSALPPAILVEIYKNPTYYPHIWPLKYLIYAGGPLPKDVGDQISTKTKLTILTGSTEIGLPAIELPLDPRDWEYVAYSPVMGFDFRLTDVDGLYEQVVVRDKRLDLFQSVFATFPHVDEFSLHDVYEQHSSKPGLYRLSGRTDDIIAFSTAEKLNPVTMEQVISGHPAIRSALVAGHGRFQSSLLVELVSPFSDPHKEIEMLEEIWPVIEQANQTCPTHGRIMRDFIIFSKPQKPFKRTAKGTVQRITTLQAYEQDIDDLYEKGLPRPALSQKQTQGGEATFEQSLYEVVRKNTLIGDFSLTADMFEQGLDSLQAMGLPKHINSFLKSQRPGLKVVSTEMIYAHPSIMRLALAVKVSTLAQDSATSQFSRMSDQLNRLVTQLHLPGSVKATTSDTPPAIVLTGSTGLVGSYLLNCILSMPGVGKVFCLCRGENGRARQVESHIQKGLSTNFDQVEFIRCDLSEPNLALNPKTYADLCETVTHIVHSAWDVNFNRSFDSFVNTHLSGTKELLNLGMQGLQKPTFLFISTVATVNSPSANRRHEVLEQPSEDWNTALANGYAQSKLIAENLVTYAGRLSGNRMIICRLGHITGATSGPGEWTRDDWLSALITTSIKLYVIPDSLGAYNIIDWIPADDAAKILLELLFSQREGRADPSNAQESGIEQCGRTEFFHVTNPSVTSWQALLPAIRENCSHGLQFVPYRDWLSKLQEFSTGNFGGRDTGLAASKLTNFFEQLAAQLDDQPVILDTTCTSRISRAFNTQGPVTHASTRAWMRQWGVSSDSSSSVCSMGS